MRLKKKGVIITGGASGIGEAAVRKVLSEGGKAVIADLNEEKGQALVAELGQDRVRYVNTDVVDTQAV
ncbi:MAG: SDR family NAD(P)-dependent oxidoreductase, partial [Spiribacter sp.]|nr:SDR family NAD(P)-dependent oxidoreductase [Spiribacter sp.]